MDQNSVRTLSCPLDSVQASPEFHDIYAEVWRCLGVEGVDWAEPFDRFSTISILFVTVKTPRPVNWE